MKTYDCYVITVSVDSAPDEDEVVGVFYTKSFAEKELKKLLMTYDKYATKLTYRVNLWTVDDVDVVDYLVAHSEDGDYETIHDAISGMIEDGDMDLVTGYTISPD